MDELEQFRVYLHESEKTWRTQQEYLRIVRRMLEEMPQPFHKGDVLDYRERLKKRYCCSTVNVHIAAMNRYFDFHHLDYHIKSVRYQRKAYIAESRNLTIEEYYRLLESCHNERARLLIQTLCSTGIRISELHAIQAEALDQGSIRIDCKGKVREILLPNKLVEKLREYCEKRGIRKGAIFITESGKPLDRSNIWRTMKSVCRKAGIEESKVFPHNLRHLFAKVYFEKERDLPQLASILGHSSINTTRIYLMSDGSRQRQQMNELGLILE